MDSKQVYSRLRTDRDALTETPPTPPPGQRPLHIWTYRREEGWEHTLQRRKRRRRKVQTLQPVFHQRREREGERETGVYRCIQVVLPAQQS